MTRFEEFDEAAYYKQHPELKRPTKCPANFRSKTLKVEPKVPGESKYHAQRTNGYPSKKHAEYAVQLALRQKAGEVWFWLEEVPFKLPGGVKHRVDFMVFYREDPNWLHGEGEWELVEVKGRDLPIGKLKRKQVEAIYNIHITVV